MTPDPQILADLHELCFPNTRSWSATEFATFLADDKTIFAGDERAFALGHIVLDEVELLTIAVSPDHRRHGLGHDRLSAFEKIGAARGGVTCFLEVAENNHAALELYAQSGYRESGRRKGYYRQKDTKAVDAILLRKPLIRD